MKKIILNHKSYLMYDEIFDFKCKLDSLNYNNIEFILFPSIQYLSMFRNSKYFIGTNNFYSSKQGSYPGEVNLESLIDMGINYTMIGQYERIKLLGESKTIIKEKLFKSLNTKCNTMLCVGENKKSKKSFYSIKKDLNMYLKTLEKKNLKYLSIIYEPKYIVSDIDFSIIKKNVNKIRNYIKNKYNMNIEIYYNGLINDSHILSIYELFDGIVLNKESTNIDKIIYYCEKIV